MAATTRAPVRRTSGTSGRIELSGQRMEVLHPAERRQPLHPTPGGVAVPDHPQQEGHPEPGSGKPGRLPAGRCQLAGEGSGGQEDARRSDQRHGQEQALPDPEPGLGHPTNDEDHGRRGRPQRHQPQPEGGYRLGGDPSAGRRPCYQQLPAAGVFLSPQPAGGGQQGPDRPQDGDDADAAPGRPAGHRFERPAGTEQGPQCPVAADGAGDLAAALIRVVGGRELLDRRRHRQPEHQPPHQTAAQRPPRQQAGHDQAGPFSAHRPPSRPPEWSRPRRSGPGTAPRVTVPGSTACPPRPR